MIHRPPGTKRRERIRLPAKATNQGALIISREFESGLVQSIFSPAVHRLCMPKMLCLLVCLHDSHASSEQHVGTTNVPLSVIML
jgi:hypothetical protein